MKTSKLKIKMVKLNQKDIVTEHKENSGLEMVGFSFGEDKGESTATGAGNRLQRKCF